MVFIGDECGAGVVVGVRIIVGSGGSDNESLVGRVDGEGYGEGVAVSMACFKRVSPGARGFG